MTNIRPGVDVAGRSDVGCQRENNEDRFLYWEPDSDAEFLQKGRLAIIADGMGGYEGGQEASRISIQTIEEIYEKSSSGDPRAWLLAGFQSAHQRILAYARQHPALHGMGTTTTALALLGLNLYYAHVGDSRLYLIRGPKVYRLTRDHSYVGRLVEQGIINPEEAETHPQRNILTAALGAGTEISPESPENPIVLEPNDVLVLCTDGLWGLVHEEEIRSAVTSLSADDACQKLIERARSLGAPDNVTVEVLHLG